MQILMGISTVRSRMAEESGGVPTGALEDIAYLARSANRVALLDALTSGAYGRRELGDLTGVATTTIGRILNECQERGWVERTSNGTYTATATGALVVREFTPLVDSMDTIRTLGEAATWVPTDELSVGIEHFADATVRRSPANAPHDTVEYLADCFREASSVRVLTFLVAPPPVVDALVEGIVDGHLTAEIVLAGGLVEFLRDQDDPPDWADYLDDGVTVYRYDEHIPCHLFLFDAKVLIMNDRPPGGGGFVVSEDETVLAATNELFERYRDDAEPVDAGVFE